MLVKQALSLLLTVIEILIFIRVIVSWLPIGRDNPLIRTLYQLTEPILGPIRRLIEKSPIGANMMFDFSPLIVWLIIRVIRNIFYI